MFIFYFKSENNTAFLQFDRHKVEFGFLIPQRKVMVDDARVRGTGLSGVEDNFVVKPSGKPAPVEKVSGQV